MSLSNMPRMAVASRRSRSGVGLLSVALCLVLAGPAWGARTLYSARNQISGGGPGAVGAFQITLSDGSLASPGTLTNDSTSGGNTIPIALSPDGKYLYAVETGNDDVDVFTVNADGTLTLKSTSAQITGMGSAIGVAVAPDGKHVYVVGNNGQQTGSTTQTSVAALKVSAVDGSLSLDGSLLVAGTSRAYANPDALGIAVAPDGGHLFLATNPNDQISQVTLGATGSLSSTVTNVTQTGAGPLGLAVSPNDNSLYVTNNGSTAPGATISAYPLASGALIGPTPTPVTVGSGGTNPLAIAVAPDAAHLWVTNEGAATTATQNVASFALNSDGTLTGGVSATPTGTAADVDGTSPQSITVSPDGKHVYVGNFAPPTGSGSGNVVVYSVGAAGALTRVSSGASNTAPELWSVAIGPNQPPTASFASPASPIAGQSASFNGSGSSDSDGSVARYDWNFGDGTALTNGGSTPSHTYASAGMFTVTLTVTDNEGCSTKLVFTGQTASCNGGPSATTSQTVNVAKGSPNKTAPVLTTTPSAGGPVGTQVKDVAHLSGLVGPDGTGSVSFKLYADAACAGTATTLAASPATVTGDGDYSSASTSPAAPGTYHWIATFSGDPNNGAVSTGCSDEMVTITKPGARRTSPNLRLGRRGVRPTRKGCVTEINTAVTASLKLKDSACVVAVITFRGTIDKRADGETLTITLRARISGIDQAVVAHARVSHGRFSFTIKLPGRNTDSSPRKRDNAGGDRWRFSLDYPGDSNLLSATATGKFTVETERR